MKKYNSKIEILVYRTYNKRWTNKNWFYVLCRQIAKYNQLLSVEDELGDLAVYAGMKSFYNIKK